MTRKNKRIIQIIAAVLFVVGFVLCGCQKNMPDAIGEQPAVQRHLPASVAPTVIPTAGQKADVSYRSDTGNEIMDVRYDLGGYGSYAP